MDASRGFHDEANRSSLAGSRVIPPTEGAQAHAMDGIATLDWASESAFAAPSQFPDPLEPPAPDATLGNEPVPVSTIGARTTLSAELLGHVTRCFPPSDQRHRILADLLANHGYEVCGDVANLASAWHHESAWGTLTPADAKLRKMILKHLCGKKPSHKNYDRVGAFLKAAAAPASPAAAASGSHSVRASFEETSERLHLALTNRARTEPFFKRALDKYFAGRAPPLIVDRELVTSDGDVLCCFCAHAHAFRWKMPSKSDFARLFEHLSTHDTVNDPAGGGGAARKRAATEAPGEAPAAGKRSVQCSLDQVVERRAAGSAQPPGAPPSRF